MRTLRYAWLYLWSRPLGALLNVLLLGLGLASITFLLLVAHQLNKAFERDLAGIDAVVGAKGSPMQLILSGVLHLDVPPGNIPLKAVQSLQENPMVKQLIPLSLGDSIQGYRIVGTTPEYLAHYRVEMAQGSIWTEPMQVVLGAQVAQALGLKLGDHVSGAHGLGGGGAEHMDSHYVVTGLLKPSGSVLDRLVLTSTESVWQVHEQGHSQNGSDTESEAKHAGKHGDMHGDAHDIDPNVDREITMALVQYRSPLAAVTFPRFVNSTTSMQAAAPALEISRLLRMLGLGTDVLKAFAGVLLLTAGLSVFIALWTALRERRTDLALLRMLGASPQKIAALLLAEALWLGLVACGIGLLLGQGLAVLLGHFLKLDQSMLVNGWAWPTELLWVPVIALGVSLLSALLPALGAYRVNVLRLLQSP